MYIILFFFILWILEIQNRKNLPQVLNGSKFAFGRFSSMNLPKDRQHHFHSIIIAALDLNNFSHRHWINFTDNNWEIPRLCIISIVWRMKENSESYGNNCPWDRTECSHSWLDRKKRKQGKFGEIKTNFSIFIN